MPPRPKRTELDPATRHYNAAVEVLRTHPLFAPLIARASLRRDKDGSCPASGWAIVTDTGFIHSHPTRRAEPEEWVYVLAHCVKGGVKVDQSGGAKGSHLGPRRM
jgi:hypothetical protein